MVKSDLANRCDGQQHQCVLNLELQLYLYKPGSIFRVNGGILTKQLSSFTLFIIFINIILYYSLLYLLLLTFCLFIIFSPTLCELTGTRTAEHTMCVHQLLV